MDLLSLLLGLPLAPVRGVIKVAELIRDEAEREMYATSTARRQLEEAEAAGAAGEISQAEKAAAQEQVVGRLVGRGREEG